MKIIENELFLEFSDAVNSGINENTILKAKERQSPSWRIIPDPTDKRKVLISFKDLKDKYKELVKARFGNPYEYIAKEPIRKLVVKDLEAEKFYLSYRFEGDKMLPVEHVKKYVQAAEWLNMLVKADENPKEIKKLLQLSITDFWIKVSEIIAEDKIDLPTAYRRLREKMVGYKKDGFAVLVHKQFGNTNAKKVNTELAESLLLELLSHSNQYDDVYIAFKYNAWATVNGFPSITDRTVCNYRRTNNHSIILQREGQAAFYETYGKQIKGKRPSCPLYMVESDDNHLDLFFLDPEDTTQHKFYHKFKAIVVTDSFNDYVLGYAYAEKMDTELVRYAYLNAMYHIKELTGNWHVPHEIKTDRWALKELRPLYQSLGNYFDTPVGSKRRGYIEQFFGSPTWKNSLKIGANNYTGNNMTAKYRGVNTEMLDLVKKDRPTIEQAPQVIESFFHRLRTAPGKSGMTRQQEWLTAFNEMEVSRRRQITDEQFLLKMGWLHAPQGRANTITNGGIEPTINGQQYWFDVPEPHYLKSVGTQVNVHYDPYDMSRVLVTDGDKLRFVATTPEYQSRAMADYKQGDRTRLNALLSQKTGHVNLVTEKANRRKEVLEENFIDPELVLQSGILTKELRQAAEISFQGNLLPPSSREYNPFDNA